MNKHTIKLQSVVCLVFLAVGLASLPGFAEEKTPKDLALPLQAKGWEDAKVRRLCLKVEQSYPQIEKEFSQPLAETVHQVLEWIGVQVVEEGEPCDAILTAKVSLKAITAPYERGIWGNVLFLSTGASVKGQLQLEGEGRATVFVPVSRVLAPPSGGNPEQISRTAAPFADVWASAILDGLFDLWGVDIYLEALNADKSHPFYGSLAAKRQIMSALVDVGVPAVEPLIVALKDDNSDIRDNAAKALGKIGDARAVEPLIVALADEEWTVRMEAAEALGKIGDARAVEPLIVALKDEDYLVRQYAAKALGKIGDARAVEPLIVALADEEWTVRIEAVEALGGIRDKRAVEPLIAVLYDWNEFVRREATKALGKIGDARAVEPLIVALKDEDYEPQSFLVEALGKIGDARAVEPLIAALKDENSYRRRDAAEALGKIGDARAVEPLIVALKDDNYDVQTAAAEALGSIKKQYPSFGRDQNKWQNWWDENKNKMLKSR